jgi:hypothetical protein
VVTQTFIQNVSREDELLGIDHEKDRGETEVSQHDQGENLEAPHGSSVVKDVSRQLIQR